jgi:phosphatidate phosphatase
MNIYVKAFLFLLIKVSLILVVVYLNLNPHKRGFYCADPSIQYPYKDETIPFWETSLFAVVSGIFTVVFVEICFTLKNKDLKNHKKEIRNQCLLDIINGVLLYALGATSTLLITELGKHTVGGLRPHFIDACKPRALDMKCFIHLTQDETIQK